MTEIIVHFLVSLNQLDWKAISSLAVLGVLLIIVNSITHYIQQRISERRTAMKKASLAFEDNVMPLMKNADNLIARLTNTLCGFVPDSEFKATLELLADEPAYEARLQAFDTVRQTWCELTALRFLQYCWAVQHFRRGVAHVINNEMIDDVEYFITDKIPMILRGKLYGRNFLLRELHDEALAFFPNRELSSIEGPTIVDLFHRLTDDSVSRRIFRQLVQCFTLQFSVPASLDKLDTGDCERFCAFSHLAIALIDLFQNIHWTSKWEEYRVFLVRTLMHWNTKRSDIIYLYYPNDLSSGNYINTYPEDLLMRSHFGRLLVHRKVKPFNFAHRFAKRYSLWLRARKFMHRHHWKSVTPKGVSITADSRHDLYISFTLSALYSSLRTYLEVSKRRKAVQVA